jgi:hypothetical protein
MSLVSLFPTPGGESGDEAPDEQVSAWLSELDPGRDSATYWMRFHRDTVAAASFELARRRRDAQTTVTDVVSSWSRAVVSAALVAAAAAGIFLVQPGTDVVQGPVGVEEVLLFGLAEPAAVELDARDEGLDEAIRFTAEVNW